MKSDCHLKVRQSNKAVESIKWGIPKIRGPNLSLWCVNYIFHWNYANHAWLACHRCQNVQIMLISKVMCITHGCCICWKCIYQYLLSLTRIIEKQFDGRKSKENERKEKDQYMLHIVDWLYVYSEMYHLLNLVGSPKFEHIVLSRKKLRCFECQTKLGREITQYPK